MFEAFAIEVLQAALSVSVSARVWSLSWDSVHPIMQRAVERGLERARSRPGQASRH